MAIYYPPNQIKPNLFANANQFVFASNNLPYSGPYHQLSNGKYYTEALHTNNSQEIIKNSTLGGDQDPAIINSGTLPLVVEVNTFTPNNSTYARVSNSNTLSKELPINIQNLPTQQDYQIGEFTRYFAKTINQDIYIEFTKDLYDRLISKDPSIYYEQYIAFKLPWRLIGNKEQVFRVNRNITVLVSQQLNLPKFGMYLKNDYLKYYK
jgi:hypothetical protein